MKHLSRIAVLTYVSLACMPAAAFAGPNAGGTIFVHDANLVYTDDTTDYCDLGTIPATCLDADVRIDGWAEDVAWKVYAAFPEDASPRLKAMVFGIEYTGQLQVHTWGSCAEFELPEDDWPASGTGVAIVWDDTQTDSLVPVCWFAGYELYGDPGLFRLTPHPGNGGQFADDSIPSILDDIADYGALGFNWDGELACPDPGPPVGACCAADGTCVLTTESGCQYEWYGAGTSCEPDNPCVVTPTHTESWGRIKHSYR